MSSTQRMFPRLMKRSEVVAVSWIKCHQCGYERYNMPETPTRCPECLSKEIDFEPYNEGNDDETQ